MTPSKTRNSSDAVTDSTASKQAAETPQNAVLRAPSIQSEQRRVRLDALVEIIRINQPVARLELVTLAGGLVSHPITFAKYLIELRDQKRILGLHGKELITQIFRAGGSRGVVSGLRRGWPDNQTVFFVLPDWRPQALGHWRTHKKTRAERLTWLRARDQLVNEAAYDPLPDLINEQYHDEVMDHETSKQAKQASIAAST